MRLRFKTIRCRCGASLSRRQREANGARLRAAGLESEALHARCSTCTLLLVTAPRKEQP